jgi:hypothetical protein
MDVAREDMARDFHGQNPERFSSRHSHRQRACGVASRPHGNHEFRAATCSRRRPRPLPSALRTRSTLSEGVTLVVAASCVNRTIGVRVCQQGDQGHSNYEGNLSPKADRQAMLGEIKRFLPPGNLRFVRPFLDREAGILVETHIPRAQSSVTCVWSAVQ